MSPATVHLKEHLGVVPAVALVSLSSTLLDVPRSDLIDALHADRYRILWVAGSYLVGSAAGMSLTGLGAQLFGLRRTFLGALALFTLAGALCGFVTDVLAMAPLRLLQGLGGGLVLSPGMVLVWHQFPARRDAAMAAYGLGVYLAAISGAVVGGLLTAYLSWHWLFWLNLPLGSLFLLLAWSRLPAEPAIPGGPVHFDVLGFLLFVLWVISLNVVLDWGQYWGWADSPVLVSWLALGLVCFAAFVVWGVAYARPLISLRPFARRNFALGIVIKSLFSINVVVLLALLTGYMVNLRGYQWWQTSLVVLPGLTTFVLAVLASVSRATPQNRPWRIGAGLVVMTASTWYVSCVDLYTSKFWLAGVLAVWGAGVGLAVAPLLALIFDGLTPAETLQGAGIFNMARALPSFAAGALLSTLLTCQADTHFDWLRQRITRNRPTVTVTLVRSELHFSDQGSSAATTAGKQAHALLARWVHANASAFAFEDVLKVLALMTALGPLLVLGVAQPAGRRDLPGK